MKKPLRLCYQDNETDSLQNQRLSVATALADALERILGDNLSYREPYLADPEDENSDLICGFDFGEGFTTEVVIPLKGRIHFTDGTIRMLFFKSLHHFRKALEGLLDNHDQIIQERCLSA